MTKRNHLDRRFYLLRSSLIEYAFWMYSIQVMDMYFVDTANQCYQNQVQPTVCGNDSYYEYEK